MQAHTSRILFTLIFPLLFADIVKAESLTLWNRNFDTAPVDQVVALAIEKTIELGHLEIVKSQPMEQGAAVNALREGHTLDLLSAATSITNDRKLLPVRIPVLQGLLGHRICLIRKGTQDTFNDIETAYDFTKKGLRICQGKDWPDTRVLIRNGFQVVKSSVYTELFEYLQSEKCDCFLRGVQEIVPEYQSRQSDLDIERRLVFYYTQPGVLYVNKSNTKLAARLELGLLRAIDDGSYHSLVEKLLGQALDHVQLEERHYLNLNNPFLSAEMKKTRKAKQLWY